MIKSNYFKILALFLGFFLGLASFTSAQEDDGSEKKFEGFNLQGYSDEGNKEWDVNGQTADIVGTQIKLSNVDANTYGERPMNVTAEVGYIDQVSGKMRLEEDVIITSDDGAQMLTDSLDWDKEADLVTTRDDVLITDDGMTVTGKGMTAKPGLKNAQIQEDVTVRVDTQPNSQEQKMLTITSDGPMTIDQENNVATFDENVIAVQESQTLKADRMEVYFDQGMSAITGMVCIGNVEIVQGENATFADKAVYNAETRKLTLSGRPKLILITEGEGAITTSGN